MERECQGVYRRKELRRSRYAEQLVQFKSFARYSGQVQSYGLQLFERLVRQREG